MPNFKQGDIVRVPFPYTDSASRQQRPALVIAAGDLATTHGLLWVLMITSAENRGWPGDVAINNLAKTGLPVPSLIRTAKIATIESRDANPLGKVTPAILKTVVANLQQTLGA
jgi:mRNA interferase MazF